MTCARDDRHSALARTTFAADRIRGAGFIGFSGSQPTRVRHGTDAGGPQLRSMKGVNAVQKRPPMTFFALVLALSARFNLIGSVTGLQLLQGLSVSVLMAFCPMTAGLLLQVRRAHGTAGAWGLLMRSVDFRRTTDKRWYLPILVLMPAVCLVVCGVMRGLGWAGRCRTQDCLLGSPLLGPNQARWPQVGCGAGRRAGRLGVGDRGRAANHRSCLSVPEAHRGLCDRHADLLLGGCLMSRHLHRRPQRPPGTDGAGLVARCRWPVTCARTVHAKGRRRDDGLCVQTRHAGVLFSRFKAAATHAVAAAPVAAGPSSDPVLILPVGATGFRQMSSFQVEALASHGYMR